MSSIHDVQSIPPARARELIQQFASVRIAIIGDVMLDTFSYGSSDRLSPEAPVPVVRVTEERCMPGGAGNVALNAARLGASASFFSVIAEDAAGEEVSRQFTAEGINIRGLVCAREYHTTEKHRIVLAGKHVLRIDREQHVVPEEALERMMGAFAAIVHEFDVIAIADYAKGVCTESVVRRIMDSARAAGIPVIVDTKPGHETWYRGATLIAPNVAEARAMTGEEDVYAAGAALGSKLSCPVIVTCGADGMVLFKEGSAYLHAPARASEIVDVSGAGDAVTVASALVYAGGGTLEEAMELGSVIAGISVERSGTAVVGYDDVLAAYPL